MKSKYAALPIFLAFLTMGFGDAVGPFVGLARERFQLSNFMAQLVPFVGFLMFEPLGLNEIWQRTRQRFALWPFRT